MGAYDEVEVLTTFENRWIGGYEVSATARQGGEDTFRVRRQSDGTELPDHLPANRIRPANSEEHRA